METFIFRLNPESRAIRQTKFQQQDDHQAIRQNVRGGAITCAARPLYMRFMQSGRKWFACTALAALFFDKRMRLRFAASAPVFLRSCRPGRLRPLCKPLLDLINAGLADRGRISRGCAAVEQISCNKFALIIDALLLAQPNPVFPS